MHYLKKFNESAYQRNDVDSIVSKLESSRDFIKEPNTGKYNWKYSYVYKNAINDCKLIFALREHENAFGSRNTIQDLTMYIEDNDDSICYISGLNFICNSLLDKLVLYDNIVDACVEMYKIVSADFKKIESFPSEEDIEDIFIDLFDNGHKLSSIDYGFYSKDYVYSVRDNRYSDLGLGLCVSGFDNYDLDENIDLSNNNDFLKQYELFNTTLNICINRFKKHTNLYVSHKIYAHNGNVMVFIKLK